MIKLKFNARCFDDFWYHLLNGQAQASDELLFFHFTAIFIAQMWLPAWSYLLQLYSFTAKL